MADPLSLYEELCERGGHRCNSGLLESLPRGTGSFDSTLELDFSQNCLRGNAFAPVPEVIRRCKNLRKLTISDNYLSNDNVATLCAALRSHPSLEELDLSKNPVSYPAGRELQALVNHSPTLRRVKLRETLMNSGLARKVEALAEAKAGARSNLPSPSVSAGDPAITGSDPTAGGSDMNAAPLGSSPSAASHRACQPKTAVAPSEAWFAMETIWSVAAADAPAADDGGWAGLANVMAHVRSDPGLAVDVGPAAKESTPRPAASTGERDADSLEAPPAAAA